MRESKRPPKARRLKAHGGATVPEEEPGGKGHVGAWQPAPRTPASPGALDRSALRKLHQNTTP